MARAGIWKKLEAESTIASSAVKFFSPQVRNSHTAGGQVSTGFKIRQIFFGAERSGGAVLVKISFFRSGGAEFQK